MPLLCFEKWQLASFEVFLLLSDSHFVFFLLFHSAMVYCTNHLILPPRSCRQSCLLAIPYCLKEINLPCFQSTTSSCLSLLFSPTQDSQSSSVSSSIVSHFTHRQGRHFSAKKNYLVFLLLLSMLCSATLIFVLFRFVVGPVGLKQCWVTVQSSHLFK